MNDTPREDDKPGLEVRTYFVRGRNALVARAEFSPLYVDYYLGLADSGQRHDETTDRLLKETVVALALHCASRPWKETTAWTVHFEEPMINVFATGNNETGDLVGTAFAESVKPLGKNVLHCDVVEAGRRVRRSAVDFEESDPFRAAEAFYARSEQRLGRYFRYAEEDFVLISAQPDCDQAWLRGLDDAAVRELDQTESLSLLEQRRFQWFCGCSQERMMEVLASSMRRDPDGLFQGGESVRMRCPRCGKRHVITRESLEAFVAAERGGG